MTKDYLVLLAESAVSRNQSVYLKLEVTDGEEKGKVFLWNSSLKPEDILYKVIYADIDFTESYPSVKGKFILKDVGDLTDAHPLRRVKVKGDISGKKLFEIVKNCTEDLSMPKEWVEFLTSQQVKDICELYGNYAAGVKVHHAWTQDGLSTHTGETLQAYLALAAAPFLKDVRHHVVVTALMFHDFGKTMEYEKGKLEVTENISLYGHVYLSAVSAEKILSRYLSGFSSSESIRRDVQFVVHAILAHSGSLEHGSPVVPATVEAYCVYICDLISARVSTLQNSFHMERNHFLGTSVLKR